MALNTMEGCSQYFKDTVVPRLREKFPNLGYKQGDNWARIVFLKTKRCKCLTEYNRMYVSVKPHLQGDPAELEEMIPPPAIISGILMHRDGRSDENFQWDDLDVMIREIRNKWEQLL